MKMIEELGMAYKTEIKGYAFYTAASTIVSQERGKNVFFHLAKEELDHIRAISRIAESLKSGEGWIGYEEAVRNATSRGEGLPIFQEENELIKRLNHDPSDTNALNIALENEEAAVAFYSRLLGEATGPEQKVFLTSLLEMEKGHLKILRWERESLLKNGFWGDTIEFSVEKETD
ncbi:MAG: ferritin family protein [Thermodesulfobacteriota bacterium]